MSNHIHGMSHTKEHNAWLDMRKRCCNTRYREYYYYGGRGITICQSWLDAFQNFLNDMGMAPTPQHSLDRINSDGNYEPSNCRWADAKTQSRNRRMNIMVNDNECLSEYCETRGLNYQTILVRLHRGWSLNRAITTPIRKRTK